MARSQTQSGSDPARGPVLAVLNVLLVLTALTAVAALVLEYGGFDLSAATRRVLHLVGFVVVGAFMLERFARMVLAPRVGAYFRENWLDFLVIAGALGAGAIAWQSRREVASAGVLYVLISQAYILISLVLRAINVNLTVADSGVRPPMMLLASFLLLSLVGSGLLMLPAAVQPGLEGNWWYQDALFTSVSATCVTGLIVQDTGSFFTPFGQGVILVLIQLGGLGIMLFGTVFALLMGKALSVRGETAMGEMLATEKVGELKRVAKFVVAATLCFEALGAILLYPMFAAPQADGVTPGVAKAVWDSVFHAISAFCNAGFSLYTDNFMAGVKGGWDVPLRSHWQLYGAIAPLIILGGLGFPVLQDCWGCGKKSLIRLWHRMRSTVAVGLHNAPRPTLTLHTKIVLASTVLLLAGGAMLLLLVEPPGRLRDDDARARRANPGQARRAHWDEMSGAQRVGGAVFQSVSARTAGFNSVDMAELSNAGKLVMCMLMCIGGSPASTAGGMKTVTFAILLLAVWSVLRRRDDVEIHKRTIARHIVRKVLALAVLYVLLVLLVTLLLAATMREDNLVDLVFEACSACGTVGLSTGVTWRLTLPAKLVVIFAMFVGRVGPLTMLMALTGGMRKLNYSYPSEHVTIG